MTVVTRFAPSPTGFLHIGGARTALFNFLFSKISNGKFLLRIEDTDRARWNKEAEKAIIDGLSWLGITFDSAPLSQYSRKKRHLEIASEMVRKGSAYRCYLTQEEYRFNKEEYEKEYLNEKYLSPWRDSNSLQNKPFVIRLKSPSTGSTSIIDIIQGKVTWRNKDLDDYVLVRSNGDPTYMLSVVVDDRDMKISHIIRGDDHLTNAARQSLIFQANNWVLPSFAHIPLLHGSDGSKLSKRHGALGIEAYRKEGFPSKAIINYLLGLGWSYPKGDIFSLNEAAKVFDLKQLNKAPSRFDRDKLSFLSSSYIKHADGKELRVWFGELGVSPKERIFYEKLFDSLSDGIELFKARAKTLLNIVDDSFFIYCKNDQFLEKQKLVHLSKVERNLVKNYLNNLNLINWDKVSLTENLNLFIKNNKIAFKDIGVPLRLVLTTSKNAIGIIDILILLGENKAKQRIDVYLTNNKA